MNTNKIYKVTEVLDGDSYEINRDFASRDNAYDFVRFLLFQNNMMPQMGTNCRWDAQKKLWIVSLPNDKGHYWEIKECEKGGK